MDATALALLEGSRRLQSQIGGLASAMLVRLGEQFRAGALSEEEFLAAFVAAEKFGHDQSASSMAEFIEEWRARQAPDVEHVPPVLDEFDSGASLGRALGTVQDLRELDRTQPEFDTEFARIVASSAATAFRHVLNGGRDTMAWSAASNGTRWRRITGSSPCSFCAMLATRSDYRTKASALTIVGRERGRGGGRGPSANYKATGQVSYGGTMSRGARKGQDRRRGKRAPGEKYHDHCGCTVAEVIGDMSPTAEQQAQRDLYEAAVEQCDADGVPRTSKNVLERMRQLDDGTVIHDAHKLGAAVEEIRLEALSEKALEERLETAMAAGDFLEAERIGEILDASFYDTSGMPVDVSDPFREDLFDWFEEQDAAVQSRFLDVLPDETASRWSEVQWEHVTGRTARQVPAEREQRAAYERHLETEFVAAENATNGFMLSQEARAAGRRPRDLWKVNEATARSWASPEMLDYWDANGRMTWTDWQDMNRGDMDAISKRAGTWLQ